MATRYYGLTIDQWFRLLAIALPILWWAIWHGLLRKPAIAATVKLMESTVLHREVLELQIRYYFTLFHLLGYIPIILISVNLLGFLENDTIGRNFYVGGTFAAAIGLVGGTSLLKHLFSGQQVLLTGAYGAGDFIEARHPHFKGGTHFRGWVKEVKLWSTEFISPDFTVFIVPNSVMIEYVIENFTRAPFYHETFYVDYNSEEQKDFLKKLPDNIRKNNTKFYGDLKEHIAKVTTDDQKEFYEVFPGMSGESWDKLRFPSTTFIDDQAIIRFPVRNFACGQALRAEIGEHDLLRKAPPSIKYEELENE